MRKLFQACWFRMQYAMFWVVVFFVENTPIFIAYPLGKFLGTVAFLLVGSKRRLIYKNLKLVYGDNCPFAKRKFARAVFVNFILAFFEFFMARRLLNQETWQKYVTGPGVDLMLQDCGKYPGAILTTGHIGSFMMLSHATYFMGYPLTSVIRPPKNPLIVEALRRFYSWSGHTIVLKKDAYQAFCEILEQKKYPTIVADQYGGRKSLEVEFFGLKAYTVAGPAALSRKFKVPLYVGALFRTGNFRFILYVEKIDPIFTDDKEKDLKQLTTAMNDILEKFIRKHPDQWFWVHRRWRHLS